MEKEIVVVIAHRLGKGQNVAKGVEAAGGKAIVVPGMAADMKLGDVMKENNATFGYKATSHLRSVEAGVTAIKQGYQVVGFGFLDTEELGRRLVEEYKRVNGL